MDRGGGGKYHEYPIHPLVRSAGCYSPTFVFVFVSVSFYSFFGPVVLYNYPPDPSLSFSRASQSRPFIQRPFFSFLFFSVGSMQLILDQQSIDKGDP